MNMAANQENGALGLSCEALAEQGDRAP